MRDGHVDADDERTITESRRLRWLVDQALILEDLPDNPAVVELEKAVTVRDGQSVVAQYLIVHPIEAPWTTRGLSLNPPMSWLRPLVCPGGGSISAAETVHLLDAVPCGCQGPMTCGDTAEREELR